MSYALDKGQALGRLERMRLVSEYNKLRGSVTDGNRIARMRGLKRMNEIRALLGAGNDAQAQQSTFPIEESDSERQAREAAGLTELMQVDARALKAAFEQEKGEPLEHKPARAAGIRELLEQGTAIDAYPRVGAQYGLNIDDGRHRVAVAAERGELITIATNAQSVERIKTLLNEAAPDRAPAPQPEHSNDAYNHDEQRSKAKRQKANNAAVDLLRAVRSGERTRESLTDEDRAQLAAYSGNGGALVGADGQVGSDYEYYTPKPIAEGIWSALAEMGFAGGKVLDPCAGTGIFGASAPKSAMIDAIELDETAGAINQVLNEGPGHRVQVSPFEAIAAATDDETHDAVVTNVPFGDASARGGNQKHDPKYQKESLETYFILRSLDKLKPGGMAAFICPPRCVSDRGGKMAKLRRRASIKAEFFGAYRLPNSVFAASGADTITDVLFFRKHSTEAAARIAELQEQAPEQLEATQVLWPEFIEGDYFKGEGKRFVLGEFKPKSEDPNQFRPIDRVLNPKSVPEIAQMLRKLPGSRIDWDALEAAPTVPVTYTEGDTLTHGGQTYAWRDGDWHALEGGTQAHDMDAMLGRFETPRRALHEGTTLDDALALHQALQERARMLDMPGWLGSLLMGLRKLDSPDARASAWTPALVGMAVDQMLDAHGRGSGANFLELDPWLSERLRESAVAAKQVTGTDGALNRALAAAATHYKPRTGYSALWRGDIETEPAAIRGLSPQQGFERLLYQAESDTAAQGWLSLDAVKQALGEDFDPLTDDAFCVSGDGTQVIRADDYFVGRYADFLARIDAELPEAPSEEVRAKLLRQKALAESRVDRVDVDRIQHSIFTPYVSLEEKAEFLRRNLDARISVQMHPSTGEPVIGHDIPDGKITDEEKLIKRVVEWANTGSVTLQGAKLAMGPKQGMQALRRMINQAGEQFSAYARANPRVRADLEARANDPKKLRFRQVEDQEPLDVPGMNPELTLHGHQNAFVRAQAREFGGINGHDVGLGKTFASLASVQYAQSRGIKRKTLFVVPGSVLANWAKEASKAFERTEDCLYVGLRKGKTRSSAYDEDLNRVLENRHAKIFMTYQAFERIRLRDDTIAQFEQYLRTVDASFAESESKKDNEKTKGKLKTLSALLGDRKGAAPYLEDMGVDSIVIDEGHTFKNSSAAADFKGGKYLSLSKPAQRGLDAQAKAWYIRGRTPKKDGVMLLTASPITNSPLEIYSMLSLAVGHERVNDRCLGVTGADQFLESVCIVENEPDITIDGIERDVNVFKGLNNVDMLRGVLHDVADIKDAQMVGKDMRVPDADEYADPVQLDEATRERLELYKQAYRYAADELKEAPVNRGDPAAFEAVSQHFGEPLELIAHPFNLINKMTQLIADKDLDRRASKYLFAEQDREKVEAIVAQWNKKPPTDKRNRPGPNATAEDAIKVKTIKEDGDVVGYEYTMPCFAWIEGNALLLDSTDGSVQDKLEAKLDKAEIAIDVSLSPKLAALLENIQAEAMSPRGVDGDGKRIPYAKQIIFCDFLGVHNKLRRLLTRRAGIPRDAIAIITGQRNSAPEQVQDIQDGFNASGEDNRYRIVIANQKAEVGINLQKGTQAIHHITTGWTPDSLQQRNGRGVRQGNKTERVSIYHYDADGTFDSAKRAMVSAKADWIGKLMQGSDADQVEIKGGMSPEELDTLINSLGNADALTRVQEQMAAQEAERRASTNREKQRVSLDSVQQQTEFLETNASAQDWIAREFGRLLTQQGHIDKLVKRLESDKLKAETRAKLEDALGEQKARREAVAARIDEACKIFPASKQYIDGQPVRTKHEGADPITPDGVVSLFLQGADRGQNKPANLIEHVRRGQAGRAEIVLEVNDQAPLVHEWSTETDLAEEIREQAIKSYEAKAKYPGAMPPGLAERFKAGQGTFVGERPVVTGCFVNFMDILYVVSVKPDKPMKGAAWGITERRQVPAGLLEVVADDTEIIYPGTPPYEAALVEAAKREDDATRNGQVPLNTYSEVVPEVAQRRETEALAAYSARRKRLPHPYFPVAINPADAEGAGALIQQIIQGQQAVIRHWNDDGLFVVSNAVEVEEANYGVHSETYLRDYAIATKQVITPDNLVVPFNEKSLERLAQDAIPIDDAKARLQQLDDEGATVEQIDEAMKALLVASLPWLAVDQMEDPLSLLPYGVEGAYYNAINRAKARAQAAGTSSDESGEDPAEQWVAVRSDFGFTSVANIRQVAKDMGEKAAWIPKSGYPRQGDVETAKNLPGAPAKTWIVRRKVFAKLVNDYPGAIQAHNVKVVHP